MTVSMNDSEEVVLTAGKRDAKNVVRLDRKHVTELDGARVHQVSGGPYKGMLISKAALNGENGEPAEARLEFLAYLVNHEKNNEPLQDYWTLKFWFRGKPDGITKKRTFTQYFNDLMCPTSFPKNYISFYEEGYPADEELHAGLTCRAGGRSDDYYYISFMKKASLLMKSYMLVKRVELEVEQVLKVRTEEVTPNIKSFVSLFTPDIYQYNFVPEISMCNKTFLTFMVKAKCDVHVALSANYGELHKRTIEVVVGAESNTRSMIKDGVEGSVRADALTANILSGQELRYFWVSWGDFRIEVGRGAHYAEGKFLEWNLPENKRFPITSLAVATDNTSHGQFEFAELFEVEVDYSKQAKKARVQKQLLWMAKKQRILYCLEAAYPNTVSVNDIMQQNAGRNLDPSTLVIMLKDLEKQTMIKEVEVGRWMRVQFETQNGSGHEMKLVRDIPQLTGKEQPTIAIVTSLYCEKLAVDAMIDEKTTFVKYKTEGESQVYTVGTIGRFKVVSTKLALSPTSSHVARISAENTITRMLGTFNKVEHVLLVGVAGGVPNLSDSSKHVRLGDVVVSMPADKNSPIYLHCSKVENNNRGGRYAFKTTAFDCKNRVLQNVATSLKSLAKSDWTNAKPWDLYADEGLELLSSQETSFKRPPPETDKVMYRNSDGALITAEHPKPSFRSKHEFRPSTPGVKHGVIGSGKLCARTYDVRTQFAELHNVRAFDLDLEAVLESLEGNRNESVLVIRGVCDYCDGTKRDWQPHAALVAAAYMKAIVMAL